ncbi:asparagine synthase (glutamine-hydrolyzing) [Pleomorphovibrio marinus]|uniref:asparagine synthase (glutamine-hydrolyzing) n=1 Tax=Pleomorphovibrio marinus TaxID=2164132 RepID=UPI000E0C9DB0|nr:asparagine synthase (glutamine-hydrolyzing) [Pleomorphovibrio marinus]
MCGLHLIINQQESQSSKPIQQMMEASTHRGPDQSGWCNPYHGTYMAGNRLKTLDLGEAANQPVATPDGKGTLVWNGALYNYQDLRNELLNLGYVFQSQSDSEVLLFWLHHHGLAGIRRLRGMFSLAYSDLRNKQVIVARDPFGMKPLYYSKAGESWVFSSESRPILASGFVKPTFDSHQYHPYFYLRHSLPDRSFYHSIRQVLPGTALVIDNHGRKVNAINLNSSEPSIGQPSTQNVKDLLLDAVLTHFHADVPVGMILSGGMDSSLLYHLWFKQTGTPLFTFTAGFEKKYKKAYPDASYSRALASKYHGEHQEVLIRPEEVLANWENYIADLDQPVGDSAGFLTWMIAKEAKKKVKILISGAGADELFGGYNRHKAYIRFLSHPSFWHRIAKLPLRFPPALRLLEKLRSSISQDPFLTYLNFASLAPLPEALKQQVWTYFPKNLAPYKSALEWDRTVYLVNDILKIHDNANMAHGIEGRAPYIDWPLIRLSSNLPEEMHREISSKKWLREILQEEGLSKITKRKKLGFGLPLKEWIRDHQGFRDYLFRTLVDFGKSEGGALPSEMRNMSLNPSLFANTAFLQLWNLFVLASWKKHHKL